MSELGDACTVDPCVLWKQTAEDDSPPSAAVCAADRSPRACFLNLGIWPSAWPPPPSQDWSPCPGSPTSEKHTAWDTEMGKRSSLSASPARNRTTSCCTTGSLQASTERSVTASSDASVVKPLGTVHRLHICWLEHTQIQDYRTRSVRNYRQTIYSPYKLELQQLKCIV